MNKTVVIPAAGLGSRLGDFTKNYSKAMCTLGKKPIISYIIEKFEDTDEIIILLGYKGDLLKQVVQSCYPEKNIRFVEVDNYDGEGSGLGYSLYCAYKYLQKPFIFWSCDTVSESFDVNNVTYDTDWMVGANADDAYFDNYRHIKINGNKVIDILPKLIKSKTNILSYTGISFIKHYKDFWHAYGNTFIQNGEAYGLMNILANKYDILVYNINDWIDTGNRTIFEKAKDVYNKNMEETILEKPDEAIWFIHNKVIKFHISESFISDRVERFSKMLNNKQKANNIILPELISWTKNTYVYKRADGEVASKVINKNMLLDILHKYLDNVEIIEINDVEKQCIYNDFYKNKTLSRIKKYCNDFEDIDKNSIIINGVECYSATELVKTVNWEKLSALGIYTNNYHGDFHLENILVNHDKYIMLDWRQNFGKTMIGDVYYDIAKMWHSLIVNHNMVKDNLFTIENIDSNNVKIDIHRTFIDTECETALIEYINDSQYNLELSKFMTAIIFLNIAACHVYPYSKFLFNLGKYLINICYKNNKDFWKK